MKELDWWGAYSGSLKGKIVDAAFQHPAKMSWNLTVRIFQHLFDEGWLKEGDLVADPFGGIGTTALAAASFGCPCILVELEEKFVDLAEQNFELHREQWEKMGKPYPVILQGDSRQFSKLIGEAVSSVITSPPYYPSGQEPSSDDLTASIKGRGYARNVYGDMTEGQLGGMLEGDHTEVVSAVVTSPPYADSMTTKETKDYAGGTQVTTRYQRSYGSNPSNMGNLPEGSHEAVVDAICTSPPFQKSEGMQDKEWFKKHREEFGGGGVMGDYAPSEGNVGALAEGDREAVVDAVVTSPPWEQVEGFQDKDFITPHGGADQPSTQYGKDGYGASEGQIGQEQGSTYWEACSQVYFECLKALRPGGVMCVVVKAFVRGGKIIDLPAQTEELLCTIGFEPLERIRAWVVSEARQESLMPTLVPAYQKEHKSFFRRLAEKKGAPRIDHEIVLFMRKPTLSDS